MRVPPLGVPVVVLAVPVAAVAVMAMFAYPRPAQTATLSCTCCHDYALSLRNDAATNNRNAQADPTSNAAYLRQAAQIQLQTADDADRRYQACVGLGPDAQRQHECVAKCTPVGSNSGSGGGSQQSTGGSTISPQQELVNSLSDLLEKRSSNKPDPLPAQMEALRRLQESLSAQTIGERPNAAKRLRDRLGQHSLDDPADPDPATATKKATIVDVRYTTAETRMMTDAEDARFRSSLYYVPNRMPLSLGGTAVSRLKDGTGATLLTIEVTWVRNDRTCCTKSYDGYGNLLSDRVTDIVGVFNIRLTNSSTCVVSPVAELQDAKSIIDASVVNSITWNSWTILHEPSQGESESMTRTQAHMGGVTSLVLVPGPTTPAPPVGQCRTPVASPR